MADNIFTNDLQGFGKSFKDKGEEWLKGKEQDLETWAAAGAKDKLIAEAKQHGINANPNMDVQKIKDMIMQKIHS